ncbi:hypothetical protein [Mucilaginibacter sp.]|uniref:hypothetical protein n=1 Tax=Mucilaginibacter sp. TaxID=1882438 RepID=UPI00263452FB|nr:hypothetical protein [Mucilaginibacter sp.]MDB5129973.1 hypothetical protein [Mucilaginibacter sp.]
MKKLIIFCLSLAIVTSSCTKKLNNGGCPTNQICTDIFASVGTQFVDKDGNNVAVKDFAVINLRTNKPIVAKNMVDPGFSPMIHTIVSDANKKELSTEGDELKVAAINAATNKPISAIFKISGGCNCHVEKLAGPEKIVVD